MISSSLCSPALSKIHGMWTMSIISLVVSCLNIYRTTSGRNFSLTLDDSTMTNLISIVSPQISSSAAAYLTPKPRPLSKHAIHPHTEAMPVLRRPLLKSYNPVCTGPPCFKTPDHLSLPTMFAKELATSADEMKCLFRASKKSRSLISGISTS